VSRLVATFFGVGLLRPAPGTWGSLAALLVAYALSAVGGAWLFVAALLLVLPLAVWCIGREVDRFGPEIGHHDPPWIVIDEVAGQWIALLPAVIVPARMGVDPMRLWPAWVAGFLLFRLFDIWKPGPVGWADRSLGIKGVLLDDLLAGVFAAVGVVVLAGLYHGILMR
jgi:phosphatidylglycerophosphatase A